MISLANPSVVNPVLSSLKVKTEDKIIFIRENSFADSNFVITHLLKQFLYEKSRICFLTLHNTFDHYQNVGKKLGYDLKEAIDQRKVMIIDPLQELVENIGKEFDTNVDPRNQILGCIFSSIKNEISSFLSTEDCPVYLIIDDLSHFLDLGIEVSEIVSFVNRCVNLTDDQHVFAVINSHVSSKADLIVANSIQYICDLFVCVSSLRTGRSNDITGVMTVRRGENENRYHFRAFDKGVKTFHPGETIYNLYK